MLPPETMAALELVFTRMLCVTVWPDAVLMTLRGTGNVRPPALLELPEASDT